MKDKIVEVWQHHGEDGMIMMDFFTTSKAARRYARKLKREIVRLLRGRCEVETGIGMCRPHWLKRIKLVTRPGRQWRARWAEDMREENAYEKQFCLTSTTDRDLQKLGT